MNARIVLMLIVFFAHMMAKAQSAPVFHYWFDNDKGNIVTVDGQVSAIDCSDLPEGLHTLYMYGERDGEPTAVESRWFLRTTPGRPGATAYYHWFDNDKGSMVKTTSGLTTIDCSKLSEGLHTLYVYGERDGEPTAVESQWFLRTAPGRPGATAYYHWFDNDKEHMVKTQDAVAAIDCSGLSSGLHCLYVYGERDGEPTTVESRWFVRITADDESPKNDVHVFVDGEFHSIVKTPHGDIMPLDIDMYDLAKGPHTLELYISTPEGLSQYLGPEEFEHIGIPESGSFTLAVLDGEGIDVSDAIEVNWRDVRGNLIGSGISLPALTVGDTVRYDIVLPGKLGVEYREVKRVMVVGSGYDHADTVRLTAFETIAVRGSVADTDNNPVAGANVEIIQYFNDKYTDTQLITVAEDGSFEVMVKNTPTRFVCSSPGFIDRTKVVEIPGEEMLDICLEPEGDRNVLIELSIIESTIDGPKKTSAIALSEDDLRYEISDPDNSGQEPVTGILGNGLIALPRSFDDVSRIRVSVTSSSGRLAGAATETQLPAEGETRVKITLEERGGIAVRNNGNRIVRTMLFDGAGNYAGGDRLGKSEAVISGLSDGIHTIVAISDNVPVSAPPRLSDLDGVGLSEGTDYAKAVVNVARGHIAVVEFSDVPEFEGGTIAEIIPDASFTANKTAVAAGVMVTGTLMLNLSEDVMSKVKGGVATFALPRECEYVQGSMVANGKAVPVTVNGHTLSVNLDKEALSSRVRLCFRSLESGDFKVMASVSLDMGATVTVPAGELFFHVSDYELYVPARTALPLINVSGVSAPSATVEVMDGESVKATVKADGFGKWSSQLALEAESSKSTHRIWSKSTLTDGFVFKTDPKTCVFDESWIVPLKVTMYNTAHPVGNLTPTEFATVFSLDGQLSQPKSYYYWPNYPVFTFVIDFSRNDPSEITTATLQVFTERNNCIVLPASYDESKRGWVAYYEFDQNDLPVNVDVEYTVNQDSEPDFSDALKFKEDIAAIDREYEEIDSIINRAEELIAVKDRTEEQNDSLMHLFVQINMHLGIEPDKEPELPEDPEERTLITDMLNATDVESASKAIEAYDKYVEAKIKDMLGEHSDKYSWIANPDAPAEEFTSSITLDDGSTISTIYTPGLKGDNGKAPDGWVVSNEESIGSGKVEMKNIKTGEKMVYDMSSLTDRISPDGSNLVDILALLNGDANKLLSSTGYIIPFIVDASEKTALLHYNSMKGTRYAASLYQDTPLGDFWQAEFIKASKKYPVAKKHALQLEKIGTTVAIAGHVTSIAGSLLDIVRTSGSWKEFENLMNEHCYGPNSDEVRKQLSRLKKNSLNDRGAINVWQIVGNTAIAVGAVTPTFVGTYFALSASLALNGLIEDYKRERDRQDQEARSVLLDQLMHSPDCDFSPFGWGMPTTNDPNNPLYRKRPYPRPNIDPIRDPSGFVYEGVVSMPVEGVTATIYRNDTTEGEGEPWVAEEYGQVNPQLTDAMGMYGWDVPRGNYRVVFEKEGYEPAMTEWLPVPPPQLDVNVSMRKTAPAELKSATATREYISIEFDTYMDASTLTASNIFFEADGRKVDATIELVNAEGAAPDAVLASKVRVVPAVAVDAPEVTLHIGSGVATYAGVALPEEIVRTLPVEDAVADLMAPAEFAVEYGSESTLRVRLLPASAVAGRTLRIVPSSSVIIGVSATEVTFDQDGYASVDIAGLLPGNAALTLTVDGYDAAVVSRITVGTTPATDVAAPEANIPSGSEVSRGSVVSLTCATPDAVIYYTTDGSCPCDPTSTRRVFDSGSPIVIEADVTIKAMAAVGAMESAIATFTYKVVTPPTILGIDGTEADGTKIYPVPVSDRLHVELPAESAESTVRVTLTNSAGATVVADECRGGAFTVNVGHLPSGVYIITLDYGDGRTESRRVIKR